MPVTQQDAAEALSMVEQAERRSSILRGYRFAAPHLLLWGGVYFAAYGYGYFQPERSWLAWAVLVPAAVVGDILIDRRTPGGLTSGVFARLFATFLALVAATAVIMRPHDPRQMAAFIPLLVAAAYIVLGMWTGRRVLLTGVSLGVLTLVGFFVLPGIFMLWMAAVGGGALVFGGLWLRQA